MKCAHCWLRGQCIAGNLNGTAVEGFASVTQQDIALRRGETLYQLDEPLRSLFAVRSGALKAYRMIGEGEERVLAFHLPGELIGMEAIGDGRHYSSVSALEDARICAIPYGGLQTVWEHVPAMHAAIVEVMCRTLGSGKASLTMITKHSAEERVLNVLADIGKRLHRGNDNAGIFRLPMTRADIGNFLGLSAETVSRMLLRLQDRKIITVNGRNVEILDPTVWTLKAKDASGLAAGLSR